MNFNKLIILVLLSPISLMAKFHTVARDQAFDDLMNKYEYAIVCFAPSHLSDKGSDKEQKKEVVVSFQDLKKRLKEASESDSFKRYLQQEVGFLLLDTASGHMKEIDEEFSLDVMPTCLLFKQGKVVFVAQHYAQIFEPISKYSILALLSKYFKNDFNALISDKQKEEKEDRQERMARYQASALVAYPYGSYGYYTGYPYDSGFFGRGYFGNRYYGNYGVGIGVGAGYSYGYW